MAYTALIASRDADTARVLTEIAKQHGMHVQLCDDADAATSFLEDHNVRLLILDYEEESRALKLNASMQDSPTDQQPIVVALVSEGNNTADLFDRGVKCILHKPVSLERVTEGMQSVWPLLPPERRRQERIAVATQATISFATKENVKVPILNLSQDGVTIYAASKMPFPCRVYFQFGLPGKVPDVRLSGDVIWQDWKGNVGIHFAHVPQASRRLIAEWLSNSEFNNGLKGTLNHSQSIHHKAKLAADQILVHSSTDEKPEIVEIAVSESDRRRQARKACRLGVNVFLAAGSALQQCILTDASEGGCYIETTQPLDVGTRLTIEVRTFDAKFRVHGKVRSSHRGYGMGVAFSLVTSEEREQTQKLLSCLDAKLEIASESILERD